jgi:outer membrane receptor protein involved in Fe transport
VTHSTPAETYGPYNIGKYQSLAVAESPSNTTLNIGSLTLDYEFPTMSVKAITSYIMDNNKTLTSETSQVANFRSNATYTQPGAASISIPSGLPFQLAYSDGAAGHFDADNRRWGISQELRFSSAANARPFSWVAGVYYSNQREKQFYQTYYDLNNIAEALYGITDVQRYGTAAQPVGANGIPFGFDLRNQEAKDTEVAAFGEGNYWITEKLKATAGVRISRVTLDYVGTFFGPVTGNATPTLANGSLTQGNLAESPITPHFGLEYQINNNDLVYVSAAKGFRAGGVNPYISRQICGPALDQYGGLSAQDLPLTYKSDSVWSYEAGAKLRFFNRVQLNTSVYEIDWSNPQVTISPGFQCGLVTTYNAISARSRGVEAEAQAAIFDGLTANVAFGYNNTEYTASYSYTAPESFAKPIPIVLDGQKFALPPYTFNVGVRYEHAVSDALKGYARVDWRFTKGYQNVPFGTAGWNPDSNVIPTVQRTNLRVGVEYGDFDINVFANNLLNSGSGSVAGGRSGCTLPSNGGTEACTTFTGYNPYETINGGYPREIGLQVVYRR